MTQPIDVAYVDIVVRDDDLKKLPKDVKKAAREAETSFEKELTDKIDNAFGHTLRKMDRDLNKFADDAGKEFKKVDLSAERAFTHVMFDVDHAVRQMSRRVRNFANDFESFFDRFFTRVRGNLSNLSNNLSQFFSQVVDTVKQLIGLLPGPFATLIILLIPPIIALASALSELVGLVGLLPTGLVVLGATIAPLIIAFQNFGEAVSALASGDLEKIDAALKKLSPSARVVAREIAALLEPLRALQRSVQQAFFTPLIGGFKQLNDVLIPTLTRGLSKVATAFGSLVRGILDFLALPEQKTFLDNLFNTVQRLTVRLGPNLLRFMTGFFEVANAALPIFERISNALSDALGDFGDWLADAARTGKLNKWIEDALTTLKELGDLLGAIIKLFGTLFKATNDEGHDLINSLTDMIIKLDDFLNTAEGKKTLDELIIAIRVFASTLEIVIALFIVSQQTFSQFIEFLHAVGVAVTNFALINLATLVHAAAAAFSWIPGLGPKLQKASDEFDAWAKDVLKKINELDGKTITINIKTIANAVALGAVGGLAKAADGAFVRARPGGTPVLVGEGGEDEVITPVSKLEQGNSITFGPGAINVNFTGVVPTPQEALDVGRAVGRGVVDIITRQNIRAQVRAI